MKEVRSQKSETINIGVDFVCLRLFFPVSFGLADSLREKLIKPRDKKTASLIIDLHIVCTIKTYK